MPYILKQNKKKGGWDIVRKDDGKTVGHSSNVHKARASVAYRLNGEKGKKT